MHFSFDLLKFSSPYQLSQRYMPSLLKHVDACLLCFLMFTIFFLYLRASVFFETFFWSGASKATKPVGREFFFCPITEIDSIRTLSFSKLPGKLCWLPGQLYFKEPQCVVKSVCGSLSSGSSLKSLENCSFKRCKQAQAFKDFSWHINNLFWYFFLCRHWCVLYQCGSLLHTLPSVANYFWCPPETAYIEANDYLRQICRSGSGKGRYINTCSTSIAYMKGCTGCILLLTATTLSRGRSRYSASSFIILRARRAARQLLSVSLLK